MSKPTDKRKILIAVSSSQNQQFLSQQASKHIPQAQFYFAADGMDAISKMNNDVPHIVIVEENLPKKNAIQMIDSILPQKKFDRVAIIVISAIPDVENFVDEVVMGKIQFTTDFGENLSKYLMRALNFVSHGDNNEFRLSFLNPGDTLMKEGDAARFVYILKKGELQASTNKTGEKVILGSVNAGEFVGEMAYISGEARSASITAMTDCELIEIPVDKLDHLLFQKPAWSKALVRTLSKRVRTSNEKIAKASQKDT